MAARAIKRLQRELSDLQSRPVEGISVDVDESNIMVWLVTLHGAPGTLYEGESFRLRFCFNSNYPIESPEVIFVDTPPIHPHIYSNGHICLSVLYEEWSPAMTVSSLCLSILSMLSSCTHKEIPRGNDIYVMTSRGRSPKDTKWDFHDDKA
eukprot:GILK01004850.1.p1 GENE.GILK01004850.1~~GILK01004850.1.p1  ORF type:complete len:173 (-),score=6.73 GILK01004850.1:174-626(-)